MTNYYAYVSDERFLNLDMPRKKEENLISEMKCAQSVLQRWEPVSIKFEVKKKRTSDFPYFDNHFPIISERALECLRDLISPDVEILPLHIVNSKIRFFGLNVLKYYVVDLNRSKCIGDYFVKEGKRNFYFSEIEVCVFPDDVLPDASMFRISEFSSLSRIYVSDQFKRVVEDNKLIGLEFDHTLNYRTGPEKRGFVNFDRLPIELDPADVTEYEKGKLVI